MSVSETPVSNRSTRNSSKCDDCGRLFRNNDVLEVHRALTHTEKTNTSLPSKNDHEKSTKPSKTTTALPSKNDNDKTTKNSKSTTALPSKNDSDKTAKPTKPAAKSKETQLAKSETKQKSGEKQAKSDVSKKTTQNDLNESKTEMETMYGSAMRTFKYKCPICSTLTFSSYSYLTAYKHIQKMHPIDENGEVVDPSSPLIIKPIRSESCVHCDLIVEPNASHTCDPTVNKTSTNNTVHHHCMGCSQTFETLKLFHNHIPSLHSDVLISLFFTTEPEFLRWKKFMELQTRMTYTKDAMFDSRRFYKCNLPLHSNKTTRNRCPSAIIVQTYDNGFQVHFYKKHYGHAGKTYKLQQEFQKNAVNKILNIPPPKEAFKEITQQTKTQPQPRLKPQPSSDLYVQLQTVMQSILQTAAKLSLPHLKEFYEKAVELKMFLNTYKGPGSSDEESEAEVNADVKVVKRDTSNVVGAKILELLENSDDDKEEAPKRKMKSKEVDKVPAKRVRRAVTIADTRKPLESKESATNNISKNIKDSDKKIEKTVDFAPKIVNTFSIKTDKEPVTPQNGKSPTSDEKPVFIKSPTFSFNDTYKDFVEKNFDVSINTSTPAVKTYKPSKKMRIRTRLGMFKPENRNRSKSDDSLSPKATSNNSSPKPISNNSSPKVTSKNSSPKVTSKNSSPKVTFYNPSPKTATPVKIESYEVKEQENDCNILILKI